MKSSKLGKKCCICEQVKAENEMSKKLYSKKFICVECRKVKVAGWDQTIADRKGRAHG
jgi:hypothetical protein